MMLEDKFKNLNVVVRGGGSLISHRPVFSADALTLHIIQSSTLLTYSTKSNLLVSKFTTPGSTPIANIHVKHDNTIMIFTQTGSLITLQPPDNILTTVQIDMSPNHWVPITSFINFVYPSHVNAYPHFLALGYPQDSGMPVLYSVSTEDGRLTKLCWSVVDNSHSVGVSGDGRFVVAVQEGSMYCKDMRDEGVCKWHSGGSRKFTCVAVHPTKEFVVATGDDSGRVVVWNNVMVDKSPAKSVFHWHTLGVVDICFSPEGSVLMSGGGECTLVSWELGDGGGKRTLPRMGMPIVHVGVSRDGGKVVVGHEDNCVQVVEGMRVSGVVKNVTWGVGGEVEYGCGVVVDPGSGGVVMNGRPGWLQVFDFLRDRGVGDVDVCGVNYVTGERSGRVGNSSVEVVGFSNDGGWMGTGETRGCDGGFKESRLKFWKRDKGKGVWVLSTVVEYPHERAFGWVRFRPVRGGGEVSCVTSGGGKVFKVWGVGEVEGGREFWSVDAVRGFKDMDAGPCCYSSDGSLLGVGFGRVVTLWDVSGGGVEFKLSLCHQRLKGDVRLMEFGVKVNSNVVVCCGEGEVYGWDVISGLLLWVVPEVVGCIGVDGGSGVVMCGRGVDVVFLDCEYGEAVGVYRDVSRSGVKGVGFVKGGGGKSVPVFLNESGEVCGLMVEEGDGEEESVRVKEDDSQLTVFGRMRAEKRVSGVGGSDGGWGGKESGVGEKAYGVLREIMDSSPHTMPSVKYYCSQLLRSLSKRTNEADRMAEMEKLVMGLGRRKMEVDDVNDRIQLNDKTNDSLSTSFDDTFSGDLDEVANEDTSWVNNVFK